MAEISASLVKELREMTGLGMMECKKALAEAGGDLKKAEELLRIKGGARAKLAGRMAGEGIIGAYLSPDAKIGALVEVNCETDFVARNEDFVEFTRWLAEIVAARNPAELAVLSKIDEVEQRLQILVQKIKENISIRRFHRLQTDARLALYLHGAKIGVLVEYEGAEEAGKNLAMHIAFAKPPYLAKSDVPPDLVRREREILAARAKESGKPAEIVAKMVDGGLNKYLGEITLLGQPFVKDDKQSVEKYLAAKKSRVLGYRVLVVGEGIEKKKAA